MFPSAKHPVPRQAAAAPRLRAKPPDARHEPLRYWPLTGYDPIPRGSVIVEFSHHEFGYFYWRRDERIDVPNPWH